MEQLLQIVRLTHLFQQIQRKVRATGEHRWETDAEHAFQLLFVAWYIIDSRKLELDLRKVILYIIVHDIPEVYAGDVCAFTDGPEVRANKEHKERAARKRLFREFPEFDSFHEILATYERRGDPEAVFVYALDKLVPFYNIMLDEGKTWKQFNTSFDELLAEKSDKIRRCPICTPLFQQVEEDIRNRQGELFPNGRGPSLPPEQIVPMPLAWTSAHEWLAHKRQ